MKHFYKTVSRILFRDRGVSQPSCPHEDAPLSRNGISKQRQHQIRNRETYNQMIREKKRSTQYKYIKSNYKYKDPKPEWAEKE